MTTDEWGKIQDLFHQATQLEGTELEKFLTQLDQYPENITREVKKLLQQDLQQSDRTIIRNISSVSQDLKIPQIEGYDVIDLIGQGGMGCVYRAFDRRLSRTIAIKVLHPHLSQQQKFKDRFMREARAAARIQHENINTVFEVGESDEGLIHIASAYCEGCNLSELIGSAKLSLENILSFMDQLVSALIAAHSQGIIHRDLKPDNIIINEKNMLTLVDFGIAKIRDEHQTSTGEIIGTPAYMSPEQFRGEAVDPQTDIWALGMILYQMLEGKTPYDGMSVPEIIYSMLNESIPFSNSTRDSYKPLYELIQACLNVDKSLRPANAVLVQQILTKARAQIDTKNLSDLIPAYPQAGSITGDRSHPSIATQRHVLILHLFGAGKILTDEEIEAARNLVKKYKGQLLSRTNSDHDYNHYLTASFGYQMADEMTVKNGLLCGLYWIEPEGTKKPSRKALAQHELVNNISRTTQITAPLFAPLNKATRKFIRHHPHSGIWAATDLLDLLPEAIILCAPKNEEEQLAGFIRIEKKTQSATYPFTINLSPFTGRESQLSILKENWDQAREGDFQRILISGEAGIGKSRLIYEFQKTVTDESSVFCIELACSPYEQSSTYYPILNYLKQQLGNGLEDSESHKPTRENVEKYLHQIIVPESLDVSLACQLIGVPLEPQEAAKLPGGDLLNRRYQSLLARLLMARPQGFTTLLIVEDLHWIDPATSLIIEQLLQPSATAATLIVLSCRPEYKPVWLTNVLTSNLYLSKLRHTQSERLLKQLISRQSRSAGPLQQIDEDAISELVVRTGGNPLFIEELVKSVVRDSSSLKQVPRSIQDTLTARLEKLGSAREVAQIAAVIGRNFRRSLLQYCCAIEPSDFQYQFDNLVKAEIFYPSTDTDNWYFKHALIRDAAYEMLLDESRQQLHATIARGIEQSDEELARSEPSLLALHWEKSENFSRAIDYWIKSALRNLQLYSIEECIEHCQHALKLVNSIEDNETADQLSLSIHMTLGPAFMTRHGYAHDSVFLSYSKALELCKKTSNDEQMIPTLFGLWTFFCVRAEHEKAKDISQQMVSISEATLQPEYLCESHMLQGINDYYRGEFTSAREHFSRSAEFYDRDEAQTHILKYGQDPFVVINSYQAWNELLLGNFEQAAEHCMTAITYARELRHPFTLVYALSFATWFFLNVGKLEQAQQLISEAIPICRERMIEVFLGLSLALQALIHFAKNDADMGQKTMQQANEVYLATGAALFIPSFLAAQAEVLLKDGKLDEAEALTDQAMQLLTHSDENWCLSLVLASKAMILNLRNDALQAEEYMQRLVTTLREQEAGGIRLLLQQKGIQIPGK